MGQDSRNFDITILLNENKIVNIYRDKVVKNKILNRLNFLKMS